MERESLEEARESPAQDLERRLALVEPGDMARGLFFNGVLEAVREVGGVELVRRCLAETGQARFIDFFLYPMAPFLRLSYRAAQLMAERQGDFPQAMQLLGRRAVANFWDSAAGQVLRMEARDVRRGLSYLATSYRASLSHSECVVAWTGERSARVVLRRHLMPAAYHEGLLRELVERMGGRELALRARQVELLGSEFELSWEQ